MNGQTTHDACESVNGDNEVTVRFALFLFRWFQFCVLHGFDMRYRVSI